MSFSVRYGDLGPVAAWTDGDCHLCGLPVDVELYARSGTHGPETATVDHLRPQSRRGSDALANLRLAHGWCNSIRGTRPVKSVRKELAGTIRAPRSSSEKTAIALAVASATAVAAGYVFANRTPAGDRPFNGTVATLFGVGTFALLRAAL